MATKLCIVTDAWLPQINGVVTTLTNLVREAEAAGWEVLVIHPGLFPNRPAPGYPEVQICWPWGVRKMVRKFNRAEVKKAKKLGLKRAGPEYGYMQLNGGPFRVWYA